MNKKNVVGFKGAASDFPLSIRAISTYLLSIASLLSVSILWDEPVLLALVLLTISIVIIGIGKDEVMTRLYLWITCGIAGAIAEYIAIQAGAWDYSLHEDAIPIWLPILWGIAAIFIQNHSKGARRLPKVVIE